MAIGKNRRLGKKGRKKKAVDPFLKKDWYTIQAPNMFSIRHCGKTLVTRTQGTKIASEVLKGRIFEINLADLTGQETDAYRKIKVICEDVQGDRLLTNFYGMDFTRDKGCSLVKKWQSIIEARADIKTTDGYTLRMFAIAFTKKQPNQLKKTCYAQSGQIRAIRKKMVEIMMDETASCDLKTLVTKFIPETIGQDIQRVGSKIFPLQNCFVRKVKILKSPKFDLVKLMEVHGETGVGGPAQQTVGEGDEVAGSGGRY